MKQKAKPEKKRSRRRRRKRRKSINSGKRCHFLFISDASSFLTQPAKLQDKVHTVKLYRLAKILI